MNDPVAARNRCATLHARTKTFRLRVAAAQAIVAHALATAPAWYVAFSGGKDSTCVLHLVRAEQPDLPAMFSVRQWEYPETEALMDRTPHLDRVAYQGKGASGPEMAPHWLSRELAVERCPGLRWLDANEVRTRGQGERSVFLGLRREENHYRRVHLASRGALFQRQDGRYHCNPIAGWSTADVWAYIVSRGCDYNRAYDILTRLDVPLDEQRTGPFGRAAHRGSIALVRQGWPRLFARLVSDVPEFGRYA